jgi:hypothetical protein
MTTTRVDTDHALPRLPAEQTAFIRVRVVGDRSYEGEPPIDASEPSRDFFVNADQPIS